MHGRHDPPEKSLMAAHRQTLTALPPGHQPAPAGFSWACAAAREPLDFASLTGETFGGTYADAAAWMCRQLGRARAFIILFARGDGMEPFLAGLDPQVRRIPMAGGAAARMAGLANGAVFPAAEDVAVFAVTEGKWDCVAVTAHFPAGAVIRCAGSDPRRFSEILSEGKSHSAHRFLAAARLAHGLSANDWDRLALITPEGTIIHLHDAGETVGCGTHLPDSREARLAIFDEARGREAILASTTPATLAFGCAGLHGLFASGKPWETLIPATYLYGELAVFAGGPAFSNLTFALLRRLDG
jgi:hypothetical protein